MYCLVQVYRIQGYCLVPPCTEKSMKSLETVQGCLCKNISACNNTYRYVPKSTFHTCIYCFAVVCTSTYWYVAVHTGSIIACTSTYWYVLSHTNFILGSKKVQNRFKPVIFCIIFTCLTAALLRCTTKFRI